MKASRDNMEKLSMLHKKQDFNMSILLTRHKLKVVADTF